MLLPIILISAKLKRLNPSRSFGSADNISLHLKNIFAEGELNEISVTKDRLVTAADGKNYRTKHYNLDAIIAVEGSAASSFQITWETIRAPVTPALSLGILSATSRLRIFALLGRYMLTM